MIPFFTILCVFTFFISRFSLTLHRESLTFQWRNSRVKKEKFFSSLLWFFKPFSLNATRAKTCERIFWYISIHYFLVFLLLAFLLFRKFYLFLCVSIPQNTECFECAAEGKKNLSRMIGNFFKNWCFSFLFFFCCYSTFMLFHFFFYLELQILLSFTS